MFIIFLWSRNTGWATSSRTPSRIAADTNDLHRSIVELIALEQRKSVGGQRFPILRHVVAGFPLKILRVLLEMVEDWGIVLNLMVPVHNGSELGNHSLGGSRAGLLLLL
jgi:hypothetical protein